MGKLYLFNLFMHIHAQTHTGYMSSICCTPFSLWWFQIKILVLKPYSINYCIAIIKMWEQIIRIIIIVILF